MVLVAVQLSVLGLYLPPVSRKLPPPSFPPQTIISLPVHTACDPLGKRARWWCWWLSNCRCWDYISRRCSMERGYLPPQTIISLPVHTAVGPSRAEGALVVLVAVQLSVLGLYLPPVLK